MGLGKKRNLVRVRKTSFLSDVIYILSLYTVTTPTGAQSADWSHEMLRFNDVCL